MLRVGITGGIGTGKSLVCTIFKLLGIPIYDADLRAKQLVDESSSIKARIINVFGTAAFSESGQYNRKFISSRIFEHPELKTELENIIHPAVIQDSEDWFTSQESNKIPYALKEAALLFESGSYRELNKIIVVDAPLDLRIKRILLRDGLPEKEIRLRIDSQWPQEVKIAKADFVIYNDGKSALIPRVWAIHHRLLEYTALSL